MKTIKFLSALALTLGLAACENYDLPNPPGQTNPAPDGYFQNSGLVLTPADQDINLVSANEANIFPTVATIDELTDFPGNEYSLEIDMQVGADANFSKYSTIATVIENEQNVTVNPDIFNGAIQEMLTREPGIHQVPVRFAAYAVLGTTRMRLGGVDATYGDETLTVQTLDPVKVIENAYYVVPCSASGTPDLSAAMKMNNTAGEGVSAYDNPEFALKFDVADGTPFYFMIAPQSAITAGSTEGLFGCLGSADNMSGKLGASYGAALIPISGAVFLTINMEQDAYTLSYAFAKLYPLSGSVKIENTMCLYTDNYINYTGVTAINRQWTIYTQPDKSGVVFYADPETEPEVSENMLNQSGLMSTVAGPKLTAPNKGNTLYYCDINLVQKTYSISGITSISVIGDGNGWDTTTAPMLTPSKDLRTWTGSDIEIGSEFKLNCNGAWDIDFGGVAVENTMGKQVYNVHYKGDDLPCEAGKYDVTVDFSAKPYTVTLVKK